MVRLQYFIKLVIYSYYILCIASKLFLKKWEFSHLGCFLGQVVKVAFQGDYGYDTVRFPSSVPSVYRVPTLLTVQYSD